MDYSIKIGGEAGQGLQTIGHVLCKVFLRGGFHIFAYQDYESRIRGGHNFYQLRFSDRPVLSSSEKVNLIVALDRESIERHRSELVEVGTTRNREGLVLYDSKSLGINHSDPSFLDVPMETIAVEKGGNKVMMNTVAVGAVLGMLNFDFSILESILRESFSRKGIELVEGNIRAARAGYDYAKEKCLRCRFNVSPIHGPRRMLISGNEALALGALAAGCKFMSAYPMTPSTGIITYLAGKAEEFGLVVEQAEDEIAAINMALGASFTGVRSLTATSGGGFCLMTEGVSLAAMTETPIVIVIGQRPGPSTGLPTRTEQGELFFVIHAGHGEFPKAVFSPGTPEDAFYLIQKAFNIAEKYQCIVFVFSDQHLADSYWSVDGLDFNRIKIERALLRDDEVTEDYRRHKITDSGVSPRAIPGQAKKAVVVTDSDEHDEEGHIVEDAETRKAMVLKRMRKLQGIASEITMPELYGTGNPDLLLIGWGSTYGALREAIDLLRIEGINASMLHFKELWPFPEGIGRVIKSAKNIYTVENNFTGQLRRLISAETGIELNGSINKFDGRPFTSGEIIRELKNALNR
ncbi:MAG: 2-oxoacid:acceptor oxidoreductase subunit alpha [Nitrospirae bacterium]|nr:2-oxoacid:acceptor oxidoreductase subunit alpha [Nitrospirota bacterium]